MLSVVALSLFVPSAEAGIYGGNPELSVKIDRPAHDIVSATVDLAKVRVHVCGGGYTDYPVDESVDLVDGVGLTITGGNLCGVTIFWDSVMTITADGPVYDFVAEFGGDVTGVNLTGYEQLTVLQNLDVISGVVYGGNPGVVVTIQ